MTDLYPFSPILPFSLKSLSITYFLPHHVSILFVLAAVVFTFARGAFLGLVTGMVVLVVRSRYKLTTILLLMIIFPPAISLLPDEYKARIASIKDSAISASLDETQHLDDVSVSVDGEIMGRLAFWNVAIKM